jgi:SWI/SNF-related matrix-associated actin-dependent regulator 1 of chromatin subfamily A
MASAKATAAGRSSLVGKRTRTGTAVESSSVPGSVASMMLPHAQRLATYLQVQGVVSAALEEERCLVTFSLHQHNALCHLLTQTTNVRVHPLPTWLLNLFCNDKTTSFKRYSAALEERTGAGQASPDLANIPAPLLSKLYPFQREGVEFALSLRGRVLIGDEMGLGKTLQAVAVASAYQQNWPVLVICPASLRINWARAFLENLPGLLSSAQVCVVLSGGDRIPPAAQVIVVSYEVAVNQIERLRSLAKPPSVAIVDESHYLKNPQSKRCQVLAPFLTRCVKRCILLSGTPALSRPLELFPQLQILDKRLFNSRHDFGLRYCNGKRTQFGWDFSGATHCTELHFVLERTLMIRRLKRRVLSQLPTKTRECVRLEIPARSRGAVADMMAAAASERATIGAASARGDGDARYQASARLRGMALAMFQDTGRVKVPAMLAHIDYLLESSESLKFLVFAHHRDVLDAIEGHLQRRRVGRIRIDGRTRAADRADLVDLFQSDDTVRVAVLSITAAGTGLTLTAASLVVMAELFWNPGHLQQCEDRVHRIGQSLPVRVQYLVAVGTVDESMWDLLSRKLQVVGQTLNGTQGSGALATDVTSTRVEADEAQLGPEGESFIAELLDRVATFAERSEEATRAAAHRAAERDRVAAGPVEESAIPVWVDDCLSESEETDSLLLHGVGGGGGGGGGGSDPANCRDESHEFALDLGAEMVLSQGDVDLM